MIDADDPRYQAYAARARVSGHAPLPPERVNPSGDSVSLDPVGLTSAEQQQYGMPRQSSRTRPLDLRLGLGR